MAYIPYSYAPFGDSEKKRVSYPLPTGGVKLSESDETLAEGKCALIKNFDISVDRVLTRKAQKIVSTPDFTPQGDFHGVTREPFCDRIVFHIGTCLYSYAGEGKDPELLSDTMPDKKSLLCDFMSKLYIYCDKRVFSLDGEFNLEQERPHAPLIYENLSHITASGTPKDVPVNLISPIIVAGYSSCSNYNFKLPELADVSMGFRVFENDVEVDPSLYTTEEGMVRFVQSYSPANRVVKIEYYLKEPDPERFDNTLYDCNIAVPFGGDSNGGTRIFFTGNENKKGYYYKSDLQDPLNVSSDEYEIIGNGSENITALKKMYGDMIVFTSRTVYRMGYTLNADGAFFSVKEISNLVGCDCPDSVQLIDNRVVFANSRQGVFIIDSTETTGEQNIKPISGNILRGNGEGLLDNSEEDLKASFAVDSGRKYMLFVKDKAYIWDYDRSAFYDSGSYSKAQERLIWYLYDNLSGDVYFELSGTLFSYVKDEAVLLAFSEDVQRSGVQSGFVSGITERMLPKIRKHMTDMSVMYRADKDAVFKLGLYADGIKYYEYTFPKSQGKKEKLRLRLPKKALYCFDFDVTGEGNIEIEEIMFDYITVTE